MQRAWWRGSRARPPRGLRIRGPNLAQARGGWGGGRDAEGSDRWRGTLGLGLVEGAGEARGMGMLGGWRSGGLFAKKVDGGLE